MSASTLRRDAGPPWQSQKGLQRLTSRESITTPRSQATTLAILPLHIKNHVVAVLSEFGGTFMFLLIAFGGTNAVNTAPQDGQPADLSANAARLLFIALLFGISIAVNVWVWFRVSGGHFNPAVTLAIMIIRGVGPLRGMLMIMSQLLAGIAASAVLHAILPGPLKVGTTLGNGTSVVQGLFIEMFATSQLIITILMLAVEKHRATFLAPVGIGLAIFIAVSMSASYTGASLNPARSFGPDLIAGHFPDYHWIYWAGPAMGSLLASAFYTTMKTLQYETVSPGADEAGCSTDIKTTAVMRSPTIMHDEVDGSHKGQRTEYRSATSTRAEPADMNTYEMSPWNTVRFPSTLMGHGEIGVAYSEGAEAKAGKTTIYTTRQL